MALSPESVQIAMPLAEKFGHAGMSLTPFPGSPLAELHSASSSEVAFALTSAGEGSLVESLAVVANMSEGLDAETPNQHLTVMNRYVEMISAAVQKHFQVARTVVAPAVQEYHERVVTTLGQITPSKLMGVEVVPMNVPEFFNNSNFESEYTRYEDLTLDSPALNMSLPNLDTETIIENLKTGSGGVDKQIEEWAAVVGHNKLKELYNEAFTQSMDGEPKGWRALVEDKQCGLDNALALFLWARKLVGNPPEETAMSLDTYNERMEAVRDQAGAKLSRVRNELDRAMKNKMLVRNYDGSKTIVYPAVYEWFMDNGGSNELIYGNALSDNRQFSAEALIGRTEELAGIWNRHVAIVQRTEANNRFSRIVEALEIEFRRMLAEEGAEDNAEERHRIQDMFVEQLGQVKPKDTECLESLCLRLMCRSRFYKTDAEKILLSINQNKEDNPSLDIREAAALALIEYVADWMAALIRVEG